MMNQWAGWFTSAGFGAVLATVVALFKMRSERGEKTEANETSITVAAFTILQKQVSEQATQIIELQRFIQDQSLAHLKEMTATKEQHKKELQESRDEHKREINDLKTEHARNIDDVERRFSEQVAELTHQFEAYKKAYPKPV